MIRFDLLGVERPCSGGTCPSIALSTRQGSARGACKEQTPRACICLEAIARSSWHLMDVFENAAQYNLMEAFVFWKHPSSRRDRRFCSFWTEIQCGSIYCEWWKNSSNRVTCRNLTHDATHCITLTHRTCERACERRTALSIWMSR